MRNRKIFQLHCDILIVEKIGVYLSMGGK